MEINGVLLGLSQKTIDVTSAIEILELYIQHETMPKVTTILNLLSSDIINLDDASKMIHKVITHKDTNSHDSKSINNLVVKNRKKRSVARALEWNEYQRIIQLCKNGFIYSDEVGESHKFRSNKQLAITFMLQANLGLRVSDVMKLSPSTFKNDKLEILDNTSGNIHYRKINKNVKDIIYEYALENNIKSNDPLIKVSHRAIQKQLDIVVKYLGLANVCSHSFRKLFCVTAYSKSNGNVELIKELFNHTSISTTERYISISIKNYQS